MQRVLLVVSGVYGFLAVALGAFGAHGLKSRFAALPDLEQRLAWWQTAAHYHLIHALAIGLAGLLVARAGAPAIWSGWCFAGGVLLFSGSLYVMTLTGVRSLGAITPVGGLFMLAGWLALVAAAWRMIGD